MSTPQVGQSLLKCPTEFQLVRSHSSTALRIRFDRGRFSHSVACLISVPACTSSCLQPPRSRSKRRLFLREPQSQHRWIEAPRSADHQRRNLPLLCHPVDGEWGLAKKPCHVANREQTAGRFESEQNVEHLWRVRLRTTREAVGVAWNLCCWGKTRGRARPDRVPHGRISI